MFAERRFAPRFLVFVALRGESGLWLADQIGPGHERCMTAVANHTERLMRIDRRMSLQAGATDVRCACGRGKFDSFYVETSGEELERVRLCSERGEARHMVGPPCAERG